MPSSSDVYSLAPRDGADPTETICASETLLAQFIHPDDTMKFMQLNASLWSSLRGGGVRATPTHRTTPTQHGLCSTHATPNILITPHTHRNPMEEMRPRSHYAQSPSTLHTRQPKRCAPASLAPSPLTLI